MFVFAVSEKEMNKKNYTFFLIVLIFFLPLIASGLLYYYHDYFHLKTEHHGILLSTPIHIQDESIKKWRVIYVHGDICDVQCKKINYQLQQVKKLLGKDSDRVNIVLLNNKNGQAKKILKWVLKKNKKNFIVEDKIYFVDPLGNLFMYYESVTNPMDMLKDLKRVLEVSQIG